MHTTMRQISARNPERPPHKPPVPPTPKRCCARPTIDVTTGSAASSPLTRKNDRPGRRLEFGPLAHHCTRERTQLDSLLFDATRDQPYLKCRSASCDEELQLTEIAR